MSKNKFICLVFIFLAVFCVSGTASQADAGAPKKLSIAVIPERDDLDFWKLLRKGAESVENEDSDVDVIWVPQPGFGSIDEQQEKVDWCIENKVDAIVISPVRGRKMRQSLSKALLKGIPVVQMVSRALNSPNCAYVHSNNYMGGVVAAKYLNHTLNGSGQVLLGLFNRGNSPVNVRVEGFKKQLKDSGSKLKIMRSIYVGGNPEKGASKIRAAIWGSSIESTGKSKIAAIVGMNESSCEVLLKTLGDMGMDEGITFVAFNPDPEMVGKIKDGSISAGVAQDPYRIGRIAVTQAAKVARGGKVLPETMTDVYLITRENLSQPDIQKILGLN
ncbi:substrate-binding domain-containing protein [Maridesulfovibrio sp.]|uniref:substrate-binding domain-containing protein n=1 Tax=Maridesulfovibrio sp. TaxID=2795000 RepID=UPI002A187217|nr:substrate-binding domain-containing protein [Maridesulfovibrio sp.]